MATCGRPAIQPVGIEPDAYDVAFNEDRAEITRHDGTLTTTLEVLVSAEDDAEVRRVSIANSGNGVREIDVTSYAELVLAPQADDVAHPAFMKLFVATEYLAAQGTLLATRRRRSPAEQEIWAAHLAIVDGEAVGKPEVETDRARFLGRGHSIHSPIAVIDGRPLSNTVGTVLDPIFALRRRVRVAPGATVRIAFWTVVAASREAVLDLVDKHRDTTAFERAATLAWTQAQVQLHHLGIDAGRSGPVPAYRRPPAECRADDAAILRYHPARCRWTARALAHGYFRRPADRAAAHRRHREPRHRPPTAAGARVLADEAVRGGSRDPERARVFLRPGSCRSRSRPRSAQASRDRRSARSDGRAGSSCCEPT